jgi:hypothetical protein
MTRITTRCMGCIMPSNMKFLRVRVNSTEIVRLCPSPDAK